MHKLIMPRIKSSWLKSLSTNGLHLPLQRGQQSWKRRSMVLRGSTRHHPRRKQRRQHVKSNKGAHAYSFPDRRRLAESLARNQAWQLLFSFCVPFLFLIAFWNSRVLNLYEVYLIYLLFVFLTQYHEDLLLPLLRAFMVLNTKLRAMILTKFIFVCGIRQVFNMAGTWFSSWESSCSSYMVKSHAFGTILKSQLTINVWCISCSCFPQNPACFSPSDEEFSLTALLTHNHSSFWSS